MGKFFNLDAPVIQFLGKLGQMMLTTLLWLVCCLPVVTIGASTAAMYRIMFNLKEDKSCAMQVFLKAFRDSFRKATVLWLLLLAAAAALLGLYYLVVLVENMILRMVVLVVFTVLMFVAYITGLYLFPLTAYFENTVGQTLRNALAMGMGNLRQSIIACAITMIPLVLLLLVPRIFLQMLFMLIVLGPGAISYGVVCALLPVFRQYAPQEEETV